MTNIVKRHHHIGGHVTEETSIELRYWSNRLGISASEIIATAVEKQLDLYRKLSVAHVTPYAEESTENHP